MNLYCSWSATSAESTKTEKMVAALYSNELNTGTEPNSRQQLVIASPVVQQNYGRATDSYFTLSLLLGLDRQCGVLMFDAGRLAAFLYV